MFELTWQSWVTLWLFTPLLVAIAWTDLTQFRIPNTYCLIGMTLFLVTLPFLGFDETLLRLGAASVSFILCVGLFALGWLGGGDAKMLPIVILAIPVPALSTYMLLLSFTMAIGMIALALCRKLVKQPLPALEATFQTQKFPMGIAIGPSGLILAIMSLN